MKKVNDLLKQEALTILLKHPEKNTAMIELLNQNFIANIEIIGHCVAVKQERQDAWVHLSCQTEEEFRHVLPYIKYEKQFAAVETKFLPLFKEQSEVLWHEDCYKLAYLKKEPFPVCEYPELQIEDAELVNHYWPYKSEHSLEYIKKRIINGESIGYFVNGELVSWIITGDDGAMGAFHTLNAHRRKGYGEAITKSLINRLLQKGKLPFVYMIKENNKSLSLTKKLNFEVVSEVSWFALK